MIRANQNTGIGRSKGPRHSGRAQLSAIDDPYKQPQKRSEPAYCEKCGAVCHEGRWQWGEAPEGAQRTVCPACHRINDRYPAGEVTITGSFADLHKDELINLARHQEEAERAEHPLNRIMAIETKEAGEMVILTTDLHLPKRIGEAVRSAYGGVLHSTFDKNGYFVRLTWRRDE